MKLSLAVSEKLATVVTTDSFTKEQESFNISKNLFIVGSK